MSQISPLPPLAPIPSSRDELVKQLARHDLLDPLIKAQAEAQQGAPTGDAGQAEGDASSSEGSDVEDVDFEEVK